MKVDDRSRSLKMICMAIGKCSHWAWSTSFNSGVIINLYGRNYNYVSAKDKHKICLRSKKWLSHCRGNLSYLLKYLFRHDVIFFNFVLIIFFQNLMSTVYSNNVQFPGVTLDPIHIFLYLYYVILTV